jgi:site-specific recombinase XerD
MRAQLNGLFEAVDEYIAASEAELKAEKTLVKYRDTLGIFKEFAGNIPLEEMSDSTLRDFIANEAGRRRIINGEEVPYSSETIYTRYKVIKGFARWLHSHKYIAEDITQYTKNPKRDYHLPEVLSETQVKNIFRKLRAEDNYRNYVIFETFLYTGIRLNELTQLKVDDLNFETGRMKVWGKGHRDETVPMGPMLMRDLKNYILNFRKPAIPAEKALFVNQDGFKLERRGVQIMVKRILRNAGVTTKVGPHILRHTFATQYLRQGGSLEALRKILRHSNINVTARYTHLLTEDVDDDYHRIGIERFGRR